MIELVWLIPLGFAAGLLGSMVGLGGGVIIVPVLTFFGLPPTLAVSNSLFAVFSNAMASTISYSRQKRIEYGVGLKLGLVSIPGTILGAYISADITSDAFKILFGMVLVSSAAYILLKEKIKSSYVNTSKLLILLIIGTSFFAGIISSFFGVGGGVIFVPLMMIIMRLGIKKVVPTSQFILLFASFTGIITHSILGHPDFQYSLLLAIGSFAGGMLGARLSLVVREKNLLILISIAILAVAIKLFTDAMDFSLF